MPLEIKIKDRIAKIEILSQNNNEYNVLIDGKKYTLDVVKVEQAVYSIINKHHSVNMEMVVGKNANEYKVNTRTDYFEVKIIDPQTRYKNSTKSSLDHHENVIESPMPGRIVKIPIKKGDTIEKGDTAIVVSAMKMESEYKATISGVVTKIYVNEGDTIDGGQPLIEIN